MWLIIISITVIICLTIWRLFDLKIEQIKQQSFTTQSL
jgi:hypothetical protein